MCRSRRELSNAYFLAKFGFDIEENEPCQVCPLSAYRSPRFILFVFLTNLTLLSMLIGVLCEVITQNTVRIKEDSIARNMKRIISTVFDEIGGKYQEGKRLLFRETFQALLENEHVEAVLASNEIDTSDLMEMEDYFFHSDDPNAELDLHEFTDMVQNFRGTHMATSLQVTIVFRLMIGAGGNSR